MELREQKLVQMRVHHQGAEVIAHPECEPSLLARAEFIGSTSALLKHVIASPRTKFIVATEVGILHRLRRANPEKQFFAANERASCAYMKVTTLPKVKASGTSTT